METFKNEYGEISWSALEDLKLHVPYKVDVYYTKGKKALIGYIPIIDNYFQFKEIEDWERTTNRIMSYFIHEFCDKGTTLEKKLTQINHNADNTPDTYVFVLKRPKNLKEMTLLGRLENYVCF